MSGHFRIIFRILLCLSIIGASSCSRRVVTSPDSLALVDQLLADSLSQLQTLAENAGKVSGSIVILGEPEECSALAEEFLHSDQFDNINASEVPDTLPDFSGETIVSLLDVANAPYEDVLNSADGRTQLREVAVRGALAALDSTIGCKVIVLASPLLAQAGAEDINDLFEYIDCKVPVLYSEDSTFSFTKECFKMMRERNMFTHNISYPEHKTFKTVSINPHTRTFKVAGCEEVSIHSFFPEADFIAVSDSASVSDSSEVKTPED